MKNYLYSIISGTLFLLCSCGYPSDTDYYEDEWAEEEQSYPDGEYCADVEYYNSNTGTRSTYTLNVEVEDNELVTIYWRNGGWLDDDHFYPSELDDGGWCEFTSDRGYDYEVQINGDPCSFHQPPGTVNTVAYLSEFGVTEMDMVDLVKELERPLEEFSTPKQCSILVELVRIIKEGAAIDALIRQSEEESDAAVLVGEGRVQKVLYFTQHDNVLCHYAIAKKNGRFYALEVTGSKKFKMGAVDFNTATTDWQTAAVQESPYSSLIDGYRVRILESASSLAAFDDLLDDYCY
jgi:hypothetical protein